MRWIKKVFWNGDEGRLRAGWRLAAQLVLNLGLALVLLSLAAYWAGPVLSESSWFALVGAALFLGATLLAVWLAGRFLDRRAFADFGLHLGRRSWWADLGVGLAVGASVPAAAVLFASAMGWVELELSPVSGIAGVPFLAAVFLSAVGYICIGFFEEIARAYHLRNLLEGAYAGWLGPLGSSVVAVVGAALISVVMHSGDVLYLFYVFVAAAVLGLFFLLTGRMAIATGSHIAYDFTLVVVFGVGAEEGGAAASLFRVRQDALTQPTAEGLGLTPLGLVFLLGVEVLSLLLLLGWVYLRYRRIGLQEALATPTLRARPGK